MQVFHLLLLALVALASLGNVRVIASKDNHGLDDWTPADVQKWFKSHGLTVKIEDLENMGLGPADALQLSELQLLKLGIAVNQQKNYYRESKKKLDSICDRPKDVFEFRACNQRLVDAWILPLLSSPEIGLLWARFFNDHKVIEKHDNEIDETPLWQFWTVLFAAPSLPFYQIAKKMDSHHTWVDETIEYTLLVMTIAQVLGILAVLKNGLPGLTAYVATKVAALLGMTIWINLAYYLFWWIMPNFLLNFFFYLGVYVTLPLVTSLGLIFNLYLLFSSKEALGRMTKKLQ